MEITEIIDINIFYNNGILNRNKLRESWVKSNLPDLYICIINYKIPIEIDHFSQKIYHYINNMDNYPICKNCGDYNKRYISFTSGYSKFCSKSCALSDVRDIIESNRRKNTIKKYGVAHTSMLDSTKKKQRETNIKKYGYVSPACNESIKLKISETNIKRYGVEYVMQNDDIKKLYIKNRINSSILEVIDKYKLNILNYDGNLFKILCDKCGLVYYSNRQLLYQRVIRYEVDTCLNCNPLDSSSGYENTLYEILSSLIDCDIIRNHRIDNKEIDIYIPNFNLGIEINGLYWHSELFKDSNYHMDKTNFFKSKNIDIIHIWEDDWLYRRDIILSIIKDRLDINKKLYSDKCYVSELSNKEAKKFLNYNYLKGYIRSDIYVGLFNDDILVSIMSFSKTMYNWKLLNFCTIIGYEIIGGYSKMFIYFRNKYGGHFISYNNYDCGYNYINNIYIELGFKLDKILNPRYTWIKNMNRYNYLGAKSKMLEDGYLRIYNSGRCRYIY